ncbi:MAG TPA: hypothetical protein VER96_02610 [Polyangiaceae bacterium]|nr:hypothetical protein [Polyangiaceae bacterium]
MIALSYACSSQTTKPGDSLAAAGASGNAVGCRPSDGDSFVPGLQKPGAAGHYDFTLLNSWPAPPALDDNRFLVQVTDADGNALDGELRVTLEMPEHGHQSPKQPEIRFDDESQAFMLDPMRLFMVGLWRITFHFEAMPDGAPLADSAVFEFCID